MSNELFSPPPMDFVDVQKLMQEDMQAVNLLIRQRLSSEVVLINQLGQYIVNSGGKRLRPLLLLLSAKVFDYQGNFQPHF